MTWSRSLILVMAELRFKMGSVDFKASVFSIVLFKNCVDLKIRTFPLGNMTGFSGYVPNYSLTLINYRYSVFKITH